MAGTITTRLPHAPREPFSSTANALPASAPDPAALSTADQLRRHSRPSFSRIEWAKSSFHMLTIFRQVGQQAPNKAGEDWEIRDIGSENFEEYRCGLKLGNAGTVQEQLKTTAVSVLVRLALRTSFAHLDEAQSA
jgi:hypothetical protein